MLIEYIRINYPEDFNDWIESSEFVAIIDLLAYVGQSLAFRMDLNTRENFLDTAENKDSVLRLARMLSYNPARNYPGFGLVKIDSLTTSEPLIDSDNRNLSGVRIDWNSATDSDWLERFLLVLNSALNVNNQFGTPVKSGSVSGIPTELYELNNIQGLNVTYPCNITSSGTTIPMEIVNGNFTDLESFYEQSPDPYAAFNLIYRNDGTGNSSATTGFFMALKQGTLKYQDLELTLPIENRIIDIDEANVNQTDVWFQEINSNGQVVSDWTKVSTVAPSSNIIYNAVEKLERDVFTVLSRDNDKISYRFADGRFGNIPQGIYRAWYRTSLNQNFIIKPQDVQNFTISIPYQNAIGQNYVLTIRYSLKTSILNSRESESIDDIKIRAPQVYYTQDRMVNGEDYNIFPIIKSDSVLKLKASNRTYSGHSRFIDINDPTGTIQNTNVFSDDGIFYKEFDTTLTELSRTTSISIQQIISSYIEPAIQGTEISNFVKSQGVIATNFDLTGTQRMFWRTTTEIANGSTGYFEQNSVIRLVGDGQLDPYYYIKQDSLINLVLADDTDSNGIWVKVDDLVNNGNGNQVDGSGTITINERIDDNVYIIKQVVPVFSTIFTDTEKSEIEEQLDLKNTFGLGYDYENSSWYVILPEDLTELDSTYSLNFAGDKSSANLDASWLVRVEYTSKTWKFWTRGLIYVWESVKDVRFFYSRDYRTVNIENGKSVSDEIKVLSINTNPDDANALGEDYLLQIDDSYVYPDGYIEPRRIKVTMNDSDQDGIPDNPQVYENVVNNGTYIFWKNITDRSGYEYKEPFDLDESFWRTTVPTGGDPASPVDGDVVFVYDVSDLTFGEFYEYDSDIDTWTDVTSDYVFNPYGRKDLKFQWKHFVDREDRIDPAISNIIDIFVLTVDYDTDIRNWLKTATEVDFEITKPKPPTSDELRLSFADVEDYKMISDQIIWKPVKYKVLFGNKTTEELKASFKVVKTQNVSITDNEIKSRVIQAVDEYFAIQNWDFGDTFYFTELSSYIHQQMATVISSVVIVPNNAESAFGNLFQIKSEPNELFVSGATVEDVEIVTNLTVNNLRIGN